MIFGESEVAWLRLTNQLMSVAILACVLVIGTICTQGPGTGASAGCSRRR